MPIGPVHNFHDKRNSIILLNDLTASAWYSLNVAANEIAFFDSSVLETGQVLQLVEITIRTQGGGTLMASGTGAAPIKIDVTGYPTANEWRIDYKVTTTDGSTNSAPGFFFDPTQDDQTSGNVNPNCPALRDKTILEGTGAIPIMGGVVFQGGYNATTNTPNLVAPSGGSVNSGMQWVVDIAGLAFFGEPLEIGDSLIARVDDPSALTDWIITQANISDLDDVPDGTNFIRVPRVKYDSDYFVSADFGNDANDGLNEERPFETLEAALDAVQTAGSGTIHILDDAIYEIQAASGTRTTTSPFTLLAPAATLVGPAGGLVWRIPTNNIQAKRIDGTNLIFEPEGSQQVFQHNFEDIDDPNTLYRGRSGNTNPRVQLIARYAKGDGVLMEATNGMKGQIVLNEGSFTFNSGSNEAPFVVNGSNTVIHATLQNLDVVNSGAGASYVALATNNGKAWIMGHCSSSDNGISATTGAKGWSFISSTGGFPLANTGDVVSHSLGEGLNFAELDDDTGLTASDYINIHDVSDTKQVKVLLSELQTFLGLDAKEAKVLQSSGIWVGPGQNIKSGTSWIWWDAADFDTGSLHDATISESGTATGVHGATTLQDTSKSWTVNEWAGYLVRITGGTNADEVAKIVSNTADTLTIDSSWITTVDNTSTYEISLAGRLTAPETATYKVGCLINFQANATGIRGVQLWKNGSTFLDTVFVNPVGTVESAVIWAAMPYELTANDYIEIKGYQDTGAALALNAFRCRFFMVKN